MWDDANEEGSGEESDESEEDSVEEGEGEGEDSGEEEDKDEEGEDVDEDEDGAPWTAGDDAKPSAIATAAAAATATATAAEDTSWLRRKGGPSGSGEAARKRRGGGKRVLYIQMEYCKRTLHDVLTEGALSEDKIWRLLRQLLGGLQVSAYDGL